MLALPHAYRRTSSTLALPPHTRVGRRGVEPNSTTRAIQSARRLYQTIAEHFETWHALASAGQFDGQGDHHTPKPFVRQTFRK